MTAKKPRSPEYLERKRQREKDRRREIREAKGFESKIELLRFLATQNAKARAVKYDCGPRGMLTVAEIAQITGVNIRSIRERIYSGKRGIELVEPNKSRTAFGSHVITPSGAAIAAARAEDTQGETVEEFMARGGQVQVIPGYSGTVYAAGLPARHYTAKGAMGL